MGKGVLALAVVSVAVGALYVWRVPPGLPYDEPSHWGTVVYYADHARMPVLGDPGVTYEAQQGPLAYAVDAVAVRAVRGLGGSERAAFDTVRVLGLLELAVFAAFVFLLTASAAPVWAAFAAGLVVAANPMLLTMSGSVQNDTLALTLGAAAIYLALTGRPSPRVFALAGALAGLAILAKLTAWLLIPAIAGWQLYRHGRRARDAVAAFVAVAAAVCGWWFVRNLILYGDLTASSAVGRSGVHFGRAALTASSVPHVAEEGITYLWLPTEYLRNTIGAPAVVKAAAALLTVGSLAAGLLRRREVRFRPLILACGVLAVATWLVPYFTFQAVAPRFAYLALPLWAVIVAAAFTWPPRRVAVLAAVIVMVMLNVWTLAKVADAPVPPSPVSAGR